MNLVRVGLTHDFLDKFPDPWRMGLDWLREDSRFAWEWFKQSYGEVQPDQAAGLDAVISLTPRWTRRSLQEADRLLLIARWGVGYDNIDLQACTEAGVMVAITPDAVRRPVAAANAAMVMALSTALFEKDRSVRQGDWHGGYARVAAGLDGKCLGSIGFGNIAKETFRLMSGFGMRYMAYSPRSAAGTAGECGVQLADLPAVLRESDYLLVNCPLNEATRGLIGAEQLASMKRSAYIVNLARGAIIDEAALIEALRSGGIAGAALDVFEREPLPADHPLLCMQQVIVTPHSLAMTEDLTSGMAEQLSGIFAGLLQGGNVPHVINREVLDHPKLHEKLARLRAGRV